MAVVTLFRNPYRSPSVHDQFDSLSYDLAVESAEMRTPLALRRAALFLQRLEAGQ
jgi:hypothetical protein